MEYAQTSRLAHLRSDIVGIDTPVPLLDGTVRPYVYLDNAASTPTFGRVLRRIEEFLPWYSGVHRGTGFKSQIATHLYDSAHAVCARFVGADPERHHVIFLKNTTECVNKLARRFAFSGDDIVLTTGLEHHSNDLPWRKVARVVHVGVSDEGSVDVDAVQEMLKRYAGRVKLVAVSGASNITGICSPIHEIAALAHEAGALVFVDAAQLVAHRPLAMLPDDDPRHIDFLAFSAHKIYAPFGTGVLIGPTAFFGEGEPDTVGGGVAAIVTLDTVEWNPVPHRDEAGSPNVVGGIALAEALCIMQSVGMEAVAVHEQRLLTYTLNMMKELPNVVLYGPTQHIENKVGVIAFNVEGMPAALVGAILGAEGGIGVRTGYFCAQPYVKRLLKVSAERASESGCGVVASDMTTFAGMVRASFGCYTDENDINHFLTVLQMIVSKNYRGEYTLDAATGAFAPKGFTPQFDRYVTPFAWAAETPQRSYSESAWG